MGSRRITTRSFSGNGRSINGDSINGSSRPGGCSYLSNVRPENRSTLCSVIAHLTEETQPSFQATLKSRAVSENCNVKFSCVVTGYPTPQVIWYKDDMQLDRYCGLPKYEIFHNGQTHSLHIYNCTVEDAAIYQASASNSKGIVSCSGVLEVGEMNEFKIHQSYFAKLKQKAENRYREAEGKENLEPLRTISPERTQRKRRSTMEGFLSAPSSLEDEGNEESNRTAAVEAETRLQEATGDDVEEMLHPVTNGEVPALTSRAVHENGDSGGTNMHESAQKAFTAHQPKTPSVKKKIKISNSAKVAKADSEKVSEERRSKEENSEEVMEVESIISSSAGDSNSRNKIKQHQKSAAEEAILGKVPLKDENISAPPSQKEQLTAASAASLTKHEKKVGYRVKQDLQSKKQCLYGTSTQSMVTTMLNKDVTKTEDVAVMDIDEKSNSSTGGFLLHRDFESADMPCQSRSALPQRLCEQAGDQLSEKEISQKNASVSPPTQLRESAQAQTKMNRNDAAVNLELPPERRMMDTQPPPPQKTPSEIETTTDDTQISSLNSGLQTPIDKMTQDTWNHSRGSSKSHAVLFTDLQKSPLESPDDGENTRGCRVSPTALQGQVDAAVKSVHGEKIESKNVNKLLLQNDSVVPNENIAEMETERAALQTVEQNQEKRADKSEPFSKKAEESRSELQKTKSDKPEPAASHLTNNLENKSKSEKMIEFKEIPKPVSKVISIAELLRAQLKALDSTLLNSVPAIPLQVDFVQEPTTPGTETRQELKEDDRKCNTEVKKSVPDRKMEAIVDETPPTNIKATLMGIYHQLNTDSTTEQIQNHGATSPPVQVMIPPVSVLETTGLHDSAEKYTESIIDTGRDTGASTVVPPTDYPVVSLTETDNKDHKLYPIMSKEELNVSSHASNADKAETVQCKDTDLVQKLTPEMKLDSNTGSGITESKSTVFLDQCPVEEHKANSSSLHSEQQILTKSVKEDNQRLQQDSSVVEVFSTNATPMASPSLQKRNCVSPIPSATPQELASGARRKILQPKTKAEEATEAPSSPENQTQKTQSSKMSTSPASLSTSPSLSRRSPLLQPPGERTSPVERRSPLFTRRKTTLDTEALSQRLTEEVHTPKTEEKNKHDPFKAPQVIRKIRSETFADASGHLKLWCQFFNVLSDSAIKWYKNEEEIVQIKRNAGDETQVNLTIVQASCKDSGVYRCSITNDYGTDSTDLLLSTDIIAGMSLREDLGVGEEIEMTPLLFNKGLADSGVWGNKLFGRIMMQESHIGDGCSHKVWRAKVIYGLEPVFESGNTCIIKVRNPIIYGGKKESCLIDRNLEMVKQECKIQNLAREYCKIFSAEARVIENFGPCLEVIPVYLMYRPANTVPYATVEADLTGVYQKYSCLDHTGRIDMRTGSGVEQKCCALQHWIFQWTNGNLLLTRLEGVDTKITNVGISVKSTGHQGLSIEGNPKVFEQFVSQHQCNYFCGLLGLRSLKVMDSLSTPVKPKASRSPLLQRKMAAGSSSPQTGRKAAGSPRMPRKAEQEGRKTPTKQRAADASKNP